GVDGWIKPYSSPGLTDSKIEFVILVAYHFLVEQTKALEHVAAVRTKRQRVDIATFLTSSAERGATHSKRRTLSNRDRPCRASLAAGHQRPANAICTRFVEGFDTALHVVGRNLTMAVHSNDHIAFGTSHTDIQRGRNGL